jgi:Rrf2 family protein
VFLEQIPLRLKHAGLLASTRGAQGGYALIKAPSTVTLGQVIRILDGPLAPIGCVSKTAYQKCQDCPYVKKTYCPLQHVMGDVRNAIADILDTTVWKILFPGCQDRLDQPCAVCPLAGHRRIKDAFA